MNETSEDFGDLCLICNEYMGQFRNLLTMESAFSRRPILQLFESFISISLPETTVKDRKICQNCFIKFNELDEHQTIVDKIQNDILMIYNNTLSTSLDIKHDIKIENYDIAAVDVHENFHFFDSEPEYYSEQKSHRKQRDEDGFIIRKRKRSKPLKKDDEDFSKGYTVMEIEGEKWYKCDVCHKVLQRRIKNHREIHTSERNIKCEVCGSMFKTLACLYTHRKIHKERKYHQCDMCGMRYLQKIQLRKHIDAIHLKRKDHICATCGKCYSRESTLQVHMLSHKAEKDVVCTVCGFRTHTKSKMSRHMKSHTGERNYACELCGKRFVYSYNVIAHVNYVHKGIRPKIDDAKLTCKFCNKKFLKVKKVKEHLAEVHNVVEQEAMPVWVVNQNID
ncbi:hypothetical protein ACKWTF_016309 [Chironomus riparius]